MVTKHIQKVKKELHKYFPTFIHSGPHHGRVFVMSTKTTLFITLCIFLFLNIIFSQNISPLYFQIMNDNKKNVITYLQTIRYESNFSSELQKYKNIYGINIAQSMLEKEQANQKVINKLELTLKKNPLSRDLLIALSSLYSKQNNQQKSQEYLYRAKNIDPSISN